MLSNQAQIYCGDSLDFMSNTEADSVDVIVTSPPYNLGIKYGIYKDDLPKAAYLAWLTEIRNGMHKVMRDSGSLFLNIGSTNKNPWVSHDVACIFGETFVLQNEIVWVKSISIADTTYGHFKPINSLRYLNNNFERILHFTKNGRVPLDRKAAGVPYMDKSNLSRWGHATEDKRCAGNVWFIPYETVQSKAQKFYHPAAFPVALADKCIRLHGNPDAVVFDPFMGSGTTLVAAQRIGCSSIGVDMDEGYVAIASERIRQEIETGGAGDE